MYGYSSELGLYQTYTSAHLFDTLVTGIDLRRWSWGWLVPRRTVPRQIFKDFVEKAIVDVYLHLEIGCLVLIRSMNFKGDMFFITNKDDKCVVINLVIFILLIVKLIVKASSWGGLFIIIFLFIIGTKILSSVLRYKLQTLIWKWRVLIVFCIHQKESLT